MNDKLEEVFYDIASRAILQAEEVECSLDEFMDGLSIIFEEARTRRDQVRRELAE